MKDLEKKWGKTVVTGAQEIKPLTRFLGELRDAYVKALIQEDKKLDWKFHYWVGLVADLLKEDYLTVDPKQTQIAFLPVGNTGAYELTGQFVIIPRDASLNSSPESILEVIKERLGVTAKRVGSAYIVTFRG